MRVCRAVIFAIVLVSVFIFVLFGIVARSNESADESPATPSFNSQTLHHFNTTVSGHRNESVSILLQPVSDETKNEGGDEDGPGPPTSDVAILNGRRFLDDSAFNFSFESRSCVSFVTIKPDQEGLGHSQANRNFAVLVAASLHDLGVCIALPKLSDRRDSIHFDKERLVKLKLEHWDDFLGFLRFRLFAQLRHQRMLARGQRFRILPISKKLSLYNAHHYIRQNFVSDVTFMLADHSDTFNHCPSAFIWRQAYANARARAPAKPVWNISSPAASSSSANVFHVVAHLRRGDVWRPSEKQSLRVHPMSFFMAILNRIDSLLKSLPSTLAPSTVHYHIITAAPKGVINKLYPQLRSTFSMATIHLNTPPQETFHSFVIADVLVIDRSRFSHLAGMLSSNVKISGGFRYNTTCDERWVSADEAGKFDDEAFVKAVRSVLAARVSNERLPI